MLDLISDVNLLLDTLLRPKLSFHCLEELRGNVGVLGKHSKISITVILHGCFLAQLEATS